MEAGVEVMETTVLLLILLEDEEVVEAKRQNFLPVLVTGNAPLLTVATPTMPGETIATNVNNLNQLELLEPVQLK